MIFFINLRIFVIKLFNLFGNINNGIISFKLFREYELKIFEYIERLEVMFEYLEE